ncbi:MAG: MAPEG family protein [Betaproteobacteria bacterium]
MNDTLLLLASCLAMVLLTFAVGARLLFVRTNEMREKRVHPQSASTSLQMASKLQNVQAADNFKNLFEVPVLFYALVAVALAASYTPGWLIAGAWLFVALRVAHSCIHCTYNKVMHRFPVFLLGFVVVVALWVVFFFTLPKSAV